MKKPKVQAIDAVMGTGKSVWLSLTILRDKKRTIIVLPRISELERYEGLLSKANGLISLSTNRGTSKKEQFKEALQDAQVILITHSLFEEHLTFDMFDTIKEGEWSLAMDEVVTIFEPIKLVTGTEIDGLVAKGVMQKVPVTDKVTKLEVNRQTMQWYLGLPACDASKNQKAMVREALIKDVLIVEEQSTRGFPTFSLNEDRLNSFTDVTVLTYPFKATDLDYWLQVKGYHVDHLKLTRVASTASLDDFKLTKHDGIYSGRDFKDRIEFVGNDHRGGVQKLYGDCPNHFSATEYKARLRGKDAEKLGPIKNTVRREFRNKRHPAQEIDAKDFMFTCPKENIGMWKDPQNGLPQTFIGESTWVPFNERAVNDHDHKHNLAFLYNVYPFTEVEKVVQAFGIEYDRNRYALYTLIQWVWRSAVRKGEKIRLYLPSQRMRDILNEWLDMPMEQISDGLCGETPQIGP